MDEAILSPKAHMASAGGPIKVIPNLLSSSGKRGFSEACPHPAQTAYRKGCQVNLNVHIDSSKLEKTQKAMYIGK